MIIELSRFNTQTAFSNADYFNTIPPLKVQQGGSFMFNSGFLDYATASPEQVIEIPEDTEITLSCGFYMCLWFAYDAIMSKSIFDFSNNNLVIQPFDLYTARYYGVSGETDYSPVISTRTFTIPKGNYSPYELTNLINESLVKVPQYVFGSGANYINNPQNNFLRSTMLGEAVVNSVNLQGEPAPVQYFNINVKNKAQLGTPEAPLFRVGDSIGLFDVIEGADLYFFKAGTAERPQFVTITEVDYANGIIWYADNWLYTTEIGDEQYKDLVSVVCYKTNTKPVRFYGQQQNSVHINDWFTMATESVMGATQMTLEFNNNQNGLFQFSYLHTPYYHTQNESLLVFGSGKSNYFDVVSTQSGVFFTQMEPQSFWRDTLGFDVDSMIMTYDPSLTTPTNRNFTRRLESGVNITANFIGNDILINKADFDGANPAPMRQLQRNAYYDESTQTQAIKALKQIGIKASNFYLVELGGLDLINMENDTQFFRTICAIGSKEYSNLGVISLYSNGMPFYTNQGDDFVLTNLRVRILDSITKQPSTTLGSKNSIFIEYQSPVQIPQPLPQPDDKKTAKKKIVKKTT